VLTATPKKRLNNGEKERGFEETLMAKAIQ
jgi:hypothetical protein